MSLNDKQEKFAQAYVLSHNASDAARIAGYAEKYSYTQGYKNLQNEEIKERIKILEQELETNVDVVEEIESQYTYAKANGHTNSAIKALELLSRVRGAKTDKNLDFTEEELEENIIKSLQILGKDKVIELLKRGGFIQK